MEQNLTVAVPEASSYLAVGNESNKLKQIILNYVVCFNIYFKNFYLIFRKVQLQSACLLQ